MPTSELYTTQELATILKVSDRTIMRWMKLGMPYMKAGRTTRFDLSDVSEWMKTRENN